MPRIRTMLVALIALSVAMLPVGGGMALAVDHDAQGVASHADCCPEGAPCEKKQKADHCGSSAACLLKCAGLAALTVAPVALSVPLPSLVKLALVPSAVRAQGEHPPLPPPRL